MSEVSGGLSNYLYRVSTSEGVIFFKQGLEEPKRNYILSGVFSENSTFCLECEKNSLEMLHGYFPNDIKVPEVLNFDRKNNVLILTDAGGTEGTNLQEILLEGSFNNSIAEKIGRFLGISHRITADNAGNLRGSFFNDMSHWQTMLQARTTDVISEDLSSEVKAGLQGLAYDSLNTHTLPVLINMDCCPKNILQNEDGNIGIIDFELACGLGDPAYDVGFCLGHYWIFAILNNCPQNAETAHKELMKGYLKEMKRVEPEEIENRIIQFAGATILYRIFGASPGPSITESKKSELIETGSKMIQHSE
ncbi:phosphotransferase family protein [Thermodesulfobacteriota bacterium]